MPLIIQVFGVSLLWVLYSTCFVHFVHAQAPVTPSGLNTQVNLSAVPPPGRVQYDITGGTRAGTNLFHSFGEFNVPANDVANFLNESALETNNILGRVTGGSSSSILGTIQTTGFGNANLSLINSAGFLFGPTASLNVGGMVTFTSADYLRLADGTYFNSIPNASADALLTAAPVAAFGFLGSNPGAITVRGSNLRVSEKSALSMVGGNITIEGSFINPNNEQPAALNAFNGRVHLASTTSPGEFVAANLDPAPNINGHSFERLGTVNILQGSVIDTSGDAGGTVLIRGGRFLMDRAVIDSSVSGLATGRGIDIQVTQDAVLQNDAGLSVNVFEESVTGSGGDIKLKSNSISIRDSFIEAVTEGEGDAGHIILQATNDLSVDNSSIFAASFFGSGNAGNIQLSSAHGNISMINLSVVTSQTLESGGNAGKITANARQGNIRLADEGQLFTATRGTGKGGGLEINAKNLVLSEGAFIADDNLGPTKPAGITISLTDSLHLRDNSMIAPVSRSLTGAPAADFTITAKDVLIEGKSRLSSETFRAGQGGNLNIFAETVQLIDGGQIRSGSTIQPVPPAPRREIPSGSGGIITIQGFSGPAASLLIDGSSSGIFTTAEGTGAGGNINISARTLMIQNGGTISAETSGTAASAIGGTIGINTTNHVTLTSGGSITASSIVKPETPNSGIANAGNIALNAGQQLEVTTGSSITTTTQSPQANGGNIDIRAIDRIQIVDSAISTSVLGAEGNGGNIFIDPKVVVLQGSEVTAKAVGGTGGNITFVTPLFLADSASLVSASSQRGPSGTVTIQSPTSNLSGAVGQLTAKTNPPQVLLQNRCVANTSSEQSSFILAGRDALPAEPGGWLSSPVSMEHWTGENLEEHASGLMVRRMKPNQSPAMIASTDAGQTLSLRRLTPPGFLGRTFAIGHTGCPS